MRRTLRIVAVLAALIPASVAAGADCRPDFVVPASYPTAIAPFQIVASDVDADGLLDLVIGTGDISAAVAVRLGKPDGTFGPSIPRPTFTGTYAFAVGRYDADAYPDVVLSTFAAGL